ncbi:DNA replication protein [Caballeronia choica]|uniref:DNA replication protein n=1 Tax=Caballeronia choica TaxID=326476 RepID=A0A158KF25_9BURK|nr:PriCT-2 domain-containing protein [Caballeronia choica]SAL79160.1 DNA replication protein [Caballeronia choica]
MSEADFAISEHERIRIALEHIPPDVDRETWRRIAAALKTELGDAGFDLFCLWSANGDKYHAPAARDTWLSQTPGRITIGTLFEIAKRYGFDTRSNRPAPLPLAARAQREAQRQKRKTSELAARDTKLKHAATVALAVWNKATSARDDHPYLTRKGVRAVEALREIDATKLAALANYTPKSNGEPLQGRVLVAPVQIDGRLSTLEMIDEAGRKSALAGGAKAGGCWSAVPIPARVSEIVIVEGVATALSIYECTGAATVAALSCSNIHKVTDAMRAQHPAAAIVVAGDVGNGESNARKAVLAAGVKLALPDFGVDRHNDQTDFNDLHQANGADAVRAAINAAAVPDAPVADTTRYPALNERPCWRMYEAPVECGGDVLKPGVYWHRVKYEKGNAPAVLTDQWTCTPLRVLAVTRNREDAG